MKLINNKKWSCVQINAGCLFLFLLVYFFNKLINYNWQAILIFFNSKSNWSNISITRVEPIDTIGTLADHDMYWILLYNWEKNNIYVIMLYDYKSLPVHIIEKPKVSLGHWRRNSKVRKTVTNSERQTQFCFRVQFSI